MDQFVVGCLRRAVLVWGLFLQRIIRWLHVSYWRPTPRTDPPDTLSHRKWGTHRYIKIHKIELHYVENGSSSKPLMLFLHGWPDFWYTWRYQLHEFSRDYWTVAIDLPGFGRSEPPIYDITHKLSNLANVVSALVGALGKSDCILVGSGTGAMLSWHVVDQYPQIVSRYIMLGMPSLGVLQDLFERGSIPLQVLLKSAFLSNAGRLSAVLARAGDYAIFDRLLGVDAKPQDVEAYKYTFAQPMAIERAIAAFRENFVDFFLEEYEFRARKQTNSPGLYVGGTDDRWCKPENYTSLLLGKYRPLEVRHVPCDGNMMHQQDPKMVNEIISQFLREDLPSPRYEDRSMSDKPKQEVVVKEVCDNCYGQEHRKANSDHDECATNCHGRGHGHRHIFTRLPICS